MMEEDPPENPPPGAPPTNASPRVLSSEALLQGAREVWIEHRGEMYRLRVTSSGKLCLTK